MLVLGLLSPIHSVQSPVLQDAAAHIQGGSPHLNESSLETELRCGAYERVVCMCDQNAFVCMDEVVKE